MLKRSFIVIILVITILGTLSAKKNKMRLAILDLNPVGVSKTTALTVSDLLRTELFKTGHFVVIERNQMDQVLKEQEFQYSGCTDTECAVQIGKLLSANKVLVGTVNKLGKAFIINARIVNVEKGTMEFGESAKVQSESELDVGCKIFANKLASMITGEEYEEEEAEEVEEVEEEEVKEPEKEEPKVYTPFWKKMSYISGGIGLLSLTAALFQNKYINDNNARAAELYQEYFDGYKDLDAKWQAYEDTYNLTGRQKTARNVLYIISGATISFSLVSYFILDDPPKKVSMTIDHKKFGFAYKF
ncbi:MAG: hypothetical protein JW827_07195 [Spirochaetes bacterium]|nr:hypothetical protein [Spirochaetota bacterium]